MLKGLLARLTRARPRSQPSHRCCQVRRPTRELELQQVLVGVQLQEEQGRPPRLQVQRQLSVVRARSFVIRGHGKAREVPAAG